MKWHAHLLLYTKSRMHMQVGSTLITMGSIPSRVTGTSVSSSTCPMVTADIALSCNRRMSSPYSLALQRTVHALIYTTIYLHRILLLASLLCKSSGQEQHSVLHLHIQWVESRQLQSVVTQVYWQCGRTLFVLHCSGLYIKTPGQTDSSRTINNPD